MPEWLKMYLPDSLLPMHRIRTFKMKIPFYAGLFFLVLLTASPANAYVLKGEHIIQLMIAENNFPGTLSLQQQVAFFDSHIEIINKVYEQRVYYRIPEEFRADIDAKDLQRIHVVSSDKALTVIDGRIVAESEIWADHYKDIFFYRSRKQLVKKLESLGINFSVTSLGRYQGMICYIIGAQYPDESVPQLWIAKDTFQPVRWIVETSTVQGIAEHKEIIYSDWKSHYNSRYPDKIEFYQARHLIRTMTVQEVQTNPQFAGDLFDIDNLKTIYSPGIIEDKDVIRQNDIQRRIKEFNRIYE